MQQTVITLVSARDGQLSAAIEKLAVSIIEPVAAETPVCDTLAPGRAVDFTINAFHRDLTGRLYTQLRGLAGCDVFVQPAADRKKRLIVADMDATMVEGETLDELAALLGLKDKIAPVTAAAMRGELRFEEALAQRVAFLEGVPLAALEEVKKTIRPAQGAAQVIRTMKRSGARAVLVSGGFDIFTAHAAQMIGFDENVGNRLEVSGELLTGRIVPPIIGREAKAKILRNEAAKSGLPPAQVIAVGDGANDLDMLQAAGAGVGYHAKPAVTQAIAMQIRHSDMLALLYMQGYKQHEIL